MLSEDVPVVVREAIRMIRDFTTLERAKLRAQISALSVMEPFSGTYRSMVRMMRNGLRQKLELGCEIVDEDDTANGER